MKAFLFLAVFTLTSPAFAQSLEDAIGLFKQERYQEAEEIFRNHDSNLARSYWFILRLKRAVTFRDKMNACSLFHFVLEKEKVPQALTYAGYCETGILGGLPRIEYAYVWMKQGYEGGSQEELPIFGKVAYLQGEYDQSFEVLNPLAEQGNALAKRYMGLMHWHGHGRKQDRAKGCTYFEDASRSQEAEDLYNLGRCYLQGGGRTPDEARANKLISKALEKGYFEGFEISIASQVSLSESPAEFAQKIEDAIATYKAQNYVEAYHKFKEFEKTGLLIIKKYLSVHYWNGDVELDLKKACDYYEDLANAGNSEATSQLGKCYLIEEARGRDNHKAYQLLKQASDMGYWEDSDLKARIAFVVGDYPSAHGAFAAAAMHGDAEAITLLGVMYRDGLDTHQSYEAACDKFERAASYKFPQALYFYGECLYTGLGRPMDKDAGYRYFKEAADLGYEYAKRIVKAVHKELYGTP